MLSISLYFLSVDFDKSKQIEVIENKSEITKANDGLRDYADVYTTTTNYSNNCDMIREVLGNNSDSDKDIRTLIDVGGVFVGLDYKDIYETIINFLTNNKVIDLPSGFQFIYFGDFEDQKDVKITIDQFGNEEKWSGDISENLYYYYDHRQIYSRGQGQHLRIFGVFYRGYSGLPATTSSTYLIKCLILKIYLLYFSR